VSDAGRILGPEDLMKRKPKELSGGQRQRVAIGRAIVRQPLVFLFDEPLSNRDAELRVHLRIEIARLHKDLAATIVYVTHDQVEAMTLADKIVVLRDGKVEQVGRPLDLYDNPKNLFLAGFIGSPRMNLLKATRQGDHFVLADFTGQHLPLALLSAKLPEGIEVTPGLRPELSKRGGAASLALQAEIVEHLGSETLIHAGQGGAGQIPTAISDEGRAIVPGQALTVRCDPAGVLVFDPAGARLR